MKIKPYFLTKKNKIKKIEKIEEFVLEKFPSNNKSSSSTHEIVTKYWRQRVSYRMECEPLATCCRDANETQTRRKCCTDKCNSIESFKSLGPSKVSCELYYLTAYIPIFCYALIVFCFMLAAFVFFLQKYLENSPPKWQPVKI